jgi:hypothetical protein
LGIETDCSFISGPKGKKCVNNCGEKKGSERNHFQDTEKFCAKIDIRKEDLCDLDLAES